MESTYKKKSMKGRLIVYVSIFVALLVGLYVLNELKPGFPDITPKQLDARLEKKESFFIYFFRPTCPHCAVTTPKLIPLAKQYNVRIEKLDGDKYGEDLDQYNIDGFPTVVFYEKGVEVERVNGELNDTSKQNYVDFLKKYAEKQS
jgi:thioredoxin 1